MVEGPLNKKNNGSFVVAYRHSFVELASAAGLNVGTQATPAKLATILATSLRPPE